MSNFTWFIGPTPPELKMLIDEVEKVLDDDVYDEIIIVNAILHCIVGTAIRYDIEDKDMIGMYTELARNIRARMKK